MLDYRSVVVNVIFVVVTSFSLASGSARLRLFSQRILSKSNFFWCYLYPTTDPWDDCIFTYMNGGFLWFSCRHIYHTWILSV